MIYTEKQRQKMIENLADSDCSEAEIQQIMTAIDNDNAKELASLIEKHREELLERFHHSKQCLDCIDYFTYQFAKTFENK